MTEKRILTLADIAAVKDQIVDEVPVPEWGGSVFVRLLPAKDALALQEATLALPPERQGGALFLLLAAVMCDEAGALLFDDVAKAEEVLGERQPEPLHRIQEAAVALRKRVEVEKKDDSKPTEGTSSSTA